MEILITIVVIVVIVFVIKSGSKKPQAYTERLGETVPVDEANMASHSGDLKRMLKAINKPTNPIDRHFLLQEIVNETYKNRQYTEMKEKCIEISEQHINELTDIAPKLKKWMNGQMPRITTFQKYATLLTEEKQYDKAIEVCNVAITLGTNDGTKSGFEGRIQRILKAKEKNNG